jgi:hypothetical protein
MPGRGYKADHALRQYRIRLFWIDSVAASPKRPARGSRIQRRCDASDVRAAPACAAATPMSSCPPTQEAAFMELSIRSEGFVLTEALDEFIRDRLRFAMARFQNAVGEVRVRLSDDNGPRGGTDKRCRFEVHIPGMRPLLINECHQD